MLAAPVAGAEAPLTEARIRSLCGEIESAVRRKDAQGVVRHFARDAVIRLVMPLSAGGQALELTVEDYARMLEDGWAMAGDSTYAVEDVVIAIGPDGRSAEVSDTTVESVKVQGRTLSSRTRERFGVELRAGRVVVTRLIGEVQM
jgi:ketosteroid isomerase-like protein